MFALCVEASHARGMGHLYRALALADVLEALGAKIQFFVNGWAPTEGMLRARGRVFEIVPLDQAGWEPEIIHRLGIRTWINDRLDTDAGHARAVRDCGVRLATFDDRGAGAALADLNIVPIALRGGEALPGKHVLTGLAYMVLDPGIAGFRRQRERLGSLVVSMGGSDTYGVTLDVVRMLKARGLSATIILGPGFEHDAALAELVDDRFPIKRKVPSLAEEFSHHDLAITAGGITPCEANAAGLPCVIVATETWETSTGNLLARLGGSIFAGDRRAIDLGPLDQLPVAAMSRAALAHVPADGADRVARAVLALSRATA